jgi:hypothetical protein
VSHEKLYGDVVLVAWSIPSINSWTFETPALLCALVVTEIVPERTEPVKGETIMIVSVTTLFTVTGVAAEVRVPPSVSERTAKSEWIPLLYFVVSQEKV